MGAGSSGWAEPWSVGPKSAVSLGPGVSGPGSRAVTSSGAGLSRAAESRGSARHALRIRAVDRRPNLFILKVYPNIRNAVMQRRRKMTIAIYLFLSLSPIGC